MNSVKAKNTPYLFLMFGLAFYFLLSIISSGVPFFWDMVNFSRMAQYYLTDHFNHLVVPEHIDDGHPPLFSLYLAFCWKIFGKKLFVFHLCMMPFMLGVVLEYYRLARKWIPSGALPLAIILLCIEPSYLSQCIIGGQDIVIVYFVLLAINRITERKTRIYTLSLIILSLLNIRGGMLVIPLGLYHLYVINHFKLNTLFFTQLKNKPKELLPYLAVALAFVGWGIYHYLIRGWAIFPPTRIAHRGFAVPIQIFRNCIYISWKMIDFGRILPFGIVFFYLIKNRLRKTIPPPFIALIVINTLFFYLLMGPLTNPIGHRYFLIIYLFISIAVSQIIYSMKRNQMRLTLSMTLVFLLAGNYILYPEKYGNGWDSSLKFLPYFKVRAQMDNYFDTHPIDSQKTGTGFPLRAEPAYSNLRDKHYYFGDKDSLPFTSFAYILQSNICNTFSEEQIKLLHSSAYQEIAYYKSGQVYMKLYKNKNTDLSK